MIELDSKKSSSKCPILLFEGVCNLCDSAVQFVINRDQREQLRFPALQSEAARSALRCADATANLLDSMAVIDDRTIHTCSSAALAVACRLGVTWSLLDIAKLVARSVRDPLCTWIARNQYQWFRWISEYPFNC